MFPMGLIGYAVVDLGLLIVGFGFGFGVAGFYD